MSTPFFAQSRYTRPLVRFASLIVTLTLGGLACLPSASAQSLFGTGATFAVGNQPGTVAVADFNGDGKPDLVVTNLNDNTVSVLLNTTTPGAATPTFATQHTFAVGIGAQSVAVADINGDGQPDIVVVNSSDGTVSVLLNTTSPGAAVPSFAAQQTFSVGSNPGAVAVGDFNGDGRPDLVVTVGNNAGVLLNTTAPGATTVSFATQTNFAAGSPVSVAVGDFNGDGKPDLAVANNGGVSVLLNTRACC